MSDAPARNDLVEGHMARLRAATTGRLTQDHIAQWICENTFLGGRPYSYVDHEYQEQFISDRSPFKVARKCAQIGMSEATIRMALARVSLIPAHVLIYTMPSATFVQTYTKTRIQPIINDSPYLRAALGGDIDSSEAKQFGSSYIWFKGAAVSNAAISVAANELLFDELDFSDPTVISQYYSRLGHSRNKTITKLSTPTVPGGPIDDQFQKSRRWFDLCRCQHCSHWFEPEYFSMVRLPGLVGDLRDLTARKMLRCQPELATLNCPRCDRPVCLDRPYREWVCENPGDSYEYTGYQIGPFSAHRIVTLPDLFKAQLTYRRRADFINFSLGLPAEDSQSGLCEADVIAARVEPGAGGFGTYVMGADMGLICRIMVAGVGRAGEVVVVHCEQVPVGQFKVRYEELRRRFRVTSKVIDSQPYLETVLSLQTSDPGLFGAFFVQKKGLELYEVRNRDEEPDEGLTMLRQVGISRNKVLDSLMDDIRNGGVLIENGPEWDTVVAELTGSRRTERALQDGEVVNQWVKPANGMDHYHMALLYTWVAARLRSTVFSPLPAGFLGVSSFRLKNFG